MFAFNGESNSATVIDAVTGKVAGTVDLGGGPEYAAADGQGFVYDNLEEENLVLKIDVRKDRDPPAALRDLYPVHHSLRTADEQVFKRSDDRR